MNVVPPAAGLGWHLPLAEDCRRLLARASALSPAGAVTCDCLLHALWELDLPGSLLLRQLGVTPSPARTDLRSEPDDAFLGDLLARASAAAARSGSRHLCDSIDVAEQILQRPWGALADHPEQDLLRGQMEWLVRELRDQKERAPLPDALRAIGRPWPAAVIRGRARELDRLLLVLLREREPRAFLVGPAGSGKTALISGLVERLRGERAPMPLVGLPVVTLDWDELALEWIRGAGPGVRARLDEEAVRQAVLVLDDLERCLTPWEKWGEFVACLLSLSAELHLRLLVLGTAAAHRQVTQAFPSLAGGLETLVLSPMDVEHYLPILADLRARAMARRGLDMEEEAVHAIAELANRHMADLGSPAGAIRLFDDATARAALRGSSRITLNDVQTALESRNGVVAGEAGTPTREGMRSLERRLGERVVGQPEAVAAVARVVRRWRAGLIGPRRPVGCLLFSGPAGGGKTELARAVAKAVFGSRDALWALEALERWPEDHRAKLPGRLHGVLVLDDVDDVRRPVRDLVLQVLQTGRLTVGRHAIDLTGCLVILTATRSGGDGEIGFLPGNGRPASGLRRILGPQLWESIDGVVPFRPLTPLDLAAIAERQLRELADRARAQGVQLEVGRGVPSWLAQRAHDPDHGARRLLRVIDECVTDTVADLLLEHDDVAAVTLRVIVSDDTLMVEFDRGTGDGGRLESDRPAADLHDRFAKDSLLRR